MVSTRPLRNVPSALAAISRRVDAYDTDPVIPSAQWARSSVSDMKLIAPCRPDHHQGAGHCDALAGTEPLRV